MTIAARMSRGSKFKVRAVGEQNYSEVHDLKVISLPEATTDQIDVSTLDTDGRMREFITGATDPGEISLEGNYKTEDPGQDTIYNFFKEGKVFEWIVEVATVSGENKIATLTGKATCSSCKRVGDLSEGEVIPFTATLKVTGETKFELINKGA